MARPMTSSEHYVSRKDGRVYFSKVGHGDALIFLHGMGVDGSGSIWRRVVGQFAKYFTCYNVDLPGFDRSDTPPSQYSMDDFALAIVNVLDSASIARTNIVGYHTGSLVAAILAAKYPERVNRMVLEGMPYWNKEQGRVVWEKAIMPMFTDTSSYDIPVEPLVSWEDAVREDPLLDHQDWQQGEEIKQKSRVWARLTYESVCGYDVREIGPEVRVPTLLVYGEGDPLRRAEQRAKEGIEGSILTVLHGSPTRVHRNEPDEFSKVAIDFLVGK